MPGDSEKCFWGHFLSRPLIGYISSLAVVLNTSGVDSDTPEHLVQGVSALALLTFGATLKRLF